MLRTLLKAYKNRIEPYKNITKPYKNPTRYTRYFYHITLIDCPDHAPVEGTCGGLLRTIPPKLPQHPPPFEGINKEN